MNYKSEALVFLDSQMRDLEIAIKSLALYKASFFKSKLVTTKIMSEAFCEIIRDIGKGD